MALRGQIYACHERRRAAALGVLVWLLVAILMPRRAVNPPGGLQAAPPALPAQRSFYAKIQYTEGS